VLGFDASMPGLGEVSDFSFVDDLGAAFVLAAGLAAALAAGLAANDAGLVSKTTTGTRERASAHRKDLARGDLMAGLSNAKLACGSSDSASI
jgi:hypothetical protein